MDRPKPKRLTWMLWLAVSLLLVLSAVVPLTYYAAPHFKRWLMVQQLTSDDLTKREEALSYVVAHLNERNPHPNLLPGVIEQMAEADDENFYQIVQALDTAKRWGRPAIPDDPWLRWLAMMISEGGEASRKLAPLHLADLPELADDPRVVKMLKGLTQDKKAPVRYQALLAAAELYGAADNRQPYEDMIVDRTDDAAPKTARQAWLMLGLINPHSGVAANWRDRPTDVAEAIIWAATRTNPDVPRPAIDALADKAADVKLRAIAAYALSYSKTSDANDALVKLILDDANDPNAARQAVAWRAILSVRLDQANENDPAAQALLAYRDRPKNDPLYLSAVHRLGAVAPVLDIQRPAILDDDDADPDKLAEHPDVVRWQHLNLVALARFEGMTPGERDVALTGGMLPQTRLAALAVTKNLNPDDLVPFMRASSMSVRDRACMIAATRLTRQQQADLAVRLLRDFDADAKISGAVLAGLTGIDPVGYRLPVGLEDSDVLQGLDPGDKIDLLQYWAEKSDAWDKRAVMWLALWMQDRLPDDSKVIPDEAKLESTLTGWLINDDLPWTTIVLAMAYKAHPEAGQFLFAKRDPLNEDPSDLVVDHIDLFDKHRWWSALQPLLADDAPKFWVWADTDLENFQVEILRTWWLLNKHREGGVFRGGLGTS